jgi:hypothetical protein
MGSFNQTSPIRVLQPQPPPQPSYDTSSIHPTFTSPFTSRINSYPQLSSWPRLPIPPASGAGRKRSRDEAALNLEEDFPVREPAAPPENEDEWEYGEGMTLVKPAGSGYTIPAGSQTGTWAEEKAEEKARAVAVPSSEGPILRSAKSQRLDLTSTPSIAEAAIGVVMTPCSASPGTGPSEPTVDDFTRHLGIGWSLISADPDIQAAARGWSRYIDNHFPITDVKIRLQSRGLASYLVEANEGFFLFGEDLKQGRLVSTSLERTWENLRGPVPAFDGEGPMEAGESPKVGGGGTPTVGAQGVEMDGVDEAALHGDGGLGGHGLEFAMDMS